MKIRKYFKKVFRISKKHFLKDQVLVIIINSISILIAGIFPFLLKDFINEIQNEAVKYEIIKIGLLLVLLSLINRSFSFWGNYLFQKLSVMGKKFLQIKLFSHLLKLPYKYFMKRKKGVISSKILSDCDILGQSMAISIPMLIINVIHLVVVITVLIILNVKLFLITLVSVPIYIGIFKYLNKKIREYQMQERKKYEQVSESIRENLAGIKMIKGHKIEDFAKNNFISILNKWVRKSIKNLKFQLLQRDSTTAIMNVTPIIILIIGGLYIIEGSLNFGGVIAFYTYLGSLFSPAQNLVEWNNGLQQSIPMAQRVFGILEKDSQNNNLIEITDITNWKLKIKNLDYLYKNKKVLKNINLNLSSGGIIGLVGASGAGKTTLIDLIIGFIKPKKGNIYIEYDNKKVKFPKKIKNFIGYCGQRDFVFQFSIYKNICLNKDYSMKKIKKILKIVKIWNFVRSLENGIETKIGENGAKLSGGQKQRILLARMLIKNPQIILLDEATSMIDTRIETKIIQNIKKHYNNKLIVIISHRLSTILHSDRLIVLKNGEIVCKGNHHKLIKNCSEYQHLYEKQYIK